MTIPFVPGGLAELAKKFIKTSAAGPNKDVAQQLLSLAMAGNLVAIQAIASRASIQTKSSAAPYLEALNALHSLPNWPQLDKAVSAAVQKGTIPAAWWQLPPNGVIPAVTAAAAHSTAPVSSHESSPSAIGAVLATLSTPAGARAAGTVAASIIRATASGRRYQTQRYRDPYTGRTRSRRVYLDPPIQRGGGMVSTEGLPVGEVASAAGAVKGIGGAGGSAAAGALAKTGVVIGGLAAGYFIGHELNNYLAGRALSKEQAGVQAALAFRQARAAAAARKGAPLTTAEVQSLGAAYKAGLVQLGYDPKTFTRTRSTVERFFTGEEEE